MSSELLNPLSSINRELADRLENDDVFRRRYIRTWAQTEVASEIRALRKLRRLRQSEVAELAQTGQSAISRIEKADYDGWTLKTLIVIACVLRAQLSITFKPIENVASGYRNPPATVPDVQVLHGRGTSETAMTDVVASTLAETGGSTSSATASSYVN